MSVTVTAANTAPVVDAGPDQTITFPNDVLLVASVTDDGLPAPGRLVYGWGLVQGPGIETIWSLNEPTTSVSFDSPGVYVLELFVSDGKLSSTDTVVVTVNDIPVVDAGPDQRIRLTGVAQLAGSVSDMGLPDPPGETSPLWSKVEGPGDVVFDDPHKLNTTATFSLPGVYALQLDAFDGMDTGTDTVTVVVIADVFDMPPPLKSLEFVTVGDPGNAPDTRVMDDGTTGYGNVDYVYQIGKYEVTVAQYCQFLNAVAATDTYGLYDYEMGDPFAVPNGLAGCGIYRRGNPGIYAYEPTPGRENCPVNYISWGGAVRFVNWLENGQPMGEQNAFTTEAGSYSVAGAISDQDLMILVRQATGHYVLPSENEWYKAAYYKGGSTDAGYWLFATQSNDVPSNVLDPDGRNNANYGQQGDESLFVGVGSFVASPGPFGTFDQSGNIDEWLDTKASDQSRMIRGGSFAGPFAHMESSYRGNDQPTSAWGWYGFRVGRVPQNLPPSVEAGDDQTIVLPAAAMLAGSGTDDGLPNPPGTLSYTWTKVSGPGDVAFGDAHSAATTASFAAPGTYVLQLEASDGEAAATDRVTITVNGNVAPVVDAGPDQAIMLPATASLSGSATDDGLPNPPGALTYAWSKVSGPGTVSFSDPAAASATATFSAAGLYVLQLEVSDGAASGTDTVTVLVKPPLRPDAVMDLTATDVQANQVTLRWTAPSAPVGSVSSYAIRYSTSPITDDAAWDTAVSVAGVPEPAAPGESQSCIVTGLQSGTTYYFAMKSANLFGLASPLSNIATATTPDVDPPDTVIQSGPPEGGVSGSQVTFTWSGSDSATPAGQTAVFLSTG